MLDGTGKVGSADEARDGEAEERRRREEQESGVDEAVLGLNETGWNREGKISYPKGNGWNM